MDEPLPPPLSVPNRDLWEAENRRREDLRRRQLERELHDAKRELDRRSEETNNEIERRIRWMGRYGGKKAGSLSEGVLQAPEERGDVLKLLMPVVAG